MIQFIRRREEKQDLNRQYSTTVGNIDWRKEKGVLRLTFQNINGFRLNKDRIKDKKLYTFLKDEEVDMMRLVEINMLVKNRFKNRL